MSDTEPISLQYTPELIKHCMAMLFRFMAIHYSDLASTFDFVEMVHKNDLETKKNIRAVADALNKNKIQSEDAIRLIIDMLDKRDDEVKRALKTINEQQVLNKWVKRHFEDEIKEKEKV